MREHETGRSHSPWRWHPWFKRIFNTVTHVSAASLLAAGMASSLAARKNKSRNDDRGGRDHADRDRDGGNDKNREAKRESEPKEDRRHQRENSDRSNGDGDSGNGNRGRKQERQDDEPSDAKSVESQQANTPTPTPTAIPDQGRDGGGGGGRGDGGGGRGDGGGNDAGNAGSGFFDNPLATKARRRADDFENADRDDDEGRIIVDVDPEGESIYETDSIFFATGPDGIEVETGNITYFAEPTPTPEPLPALEMPVREPGYPFGEDFPFGGFPFGDATVITDPTAAPEPADPGDTGTAPAPPDEPIPAADEPDPASTDGGDNTMDFSS